jgi:PAS domain S-box-containing protein
MIDTAMKFSIDKTLITAIVIVLLAITAILFVSIRQSQRVKDTATKVSYTEEVLHHVQQLILFVTDNETGSRGFVLTGKNEFLDQVRGSEQNISGELVQLQTLIADDTLQKAQVDSLSLYVDKRINLSNRMLSLRQRKGLEAAAILVTSGEGKFYTDQVRRIGMQMQGSEKSILEKTKIINQRVISRLNITLYSILGIVFLLSIIFIRKVRSDITKQKLVEKKFSALLDAAPDATVIVNEKGIIQMINLQTENLFHYTRDELIGKPVEILIPQELHKQHVHHRKDFVKAARVRTMGAGLELNAVKKNGAAFPVEISLSPIQTEEGMLISASVRDITDRKKSEEKFKGLLEAAPDAMIIANEKGKIVLINQQTERLFGYTRDELIGKPVEILIPLDFRDRHIGHRTHYFSDPKVRSMGAGLELFAIRKNGTQFPVEISLSPLVTEEGTLVSASVRDITDRKKSEEKFRSLLDAAPDATVIVNEEGIIQMINHQTENLFGYTREELIGQPVDILVPQELRGKHVHHREGFVKEARVRTMGAGLELNAVKKNGTRFPVEISLSPIQTEEGLLVSASVRDITLRKNLENELKRTNAEVEAFTYSVSHDLRAPLRGIIGFTAILEEDYTSKLDDEAKRITSVIKSNTLKMGHLIDDLLTFSRMGRQDIVKTTINTDTMIKEVIEELTPENRIGEIEWVVQSLPMIKGDINTMRQVWVNLISNAIKYSGKKENQRIEIGSFIHEGQVAFFIKDNGVGFDEKYKDKLFKVFQRLHSIDEFEGTGVGLALIEKIISKHGGKVWATGEVDKGAVFYFSLPADTENVTKEMLT